MDDQEAHQACSLAQSTWRNTYLPSAGDAVCTSLRQMACPDTRAGNCTNERASRHGIEDGYLRDLFGCVFCPVRRLLGGGKAAKRELVANARCAGRRPSSKE